LWEDSLQIRRQLSDKAKTASLLSNLGIVARRKGNNEQASALYRESLALRQELGDRWAIGVSLNNLGHLASSQRDFATARHYLERALVLWREVGDRWALANTLTNLGDVARNEGSFDDSFSLYRRSLAINHELGDKRGLAYLLEDVGTLAALRDMPVPALVLITAAAKLREEIGARLLATDQPHLQETLTLVQHRLDQQSQEAAATRGEEITLEQAVELAMNLWTENRHG
jgi:tetratricopeptide (TPR) repeat protein